MRPGVTLPHVDPSTVRARGSGRAGSRRVGLLAVAVLLTSPVLASCGFDEATDRWYTPAAGANSNEPDQSATVMGAVIVSTEPGSGTFVATLTNKSTEQPIVLESFEGAGELPVEAAEVPPTEVTPAGHVNLAEEGGLKVTGDFEAGDFVEVDLGFDNGDRVTLSVPVVPNADHFAGLDGPAPSPTEEAEEAH